MASLVILIGAALVPTCLVFALPSVEILSRNVEFFGVGGSAARQVAIAGGLAFVGIVALGLLARMRGRPGTAFWILIATGFFWPWWQALRRIVDPTRTELLDPSLAFLGMVASAIVAGTFVARRPAVARSILPIVAASGAALAAWTAVSAAGIGARAATPPPVLPVDAEVPTRPGDPLPDVLHVVLDEFQTDFFLALLDDEVRERLGGFTFYPNATTPFGRTEMALAATLLGRAYEVEVPPLDYVESAFRGERSLWARLRKAGYRTVGRLHETYPRGTPSPFDETSYHRELDDLTIGTRRDRTFLHFWIHRSLPWPLMWLLVPSHVSYQLGMQTLLLRDVPYASLLGLRDVIAERRARDESEAPLYEFVHLILPHFPPVLDRGCTFHEDVPTTMLEQAECTLRELLRLVDALERTGRFRDSMIVLHGDHGSRHVVRDDELVEAECGCFEPEWSWGRSRPLLLVKPPGIGREDPFSVDPRVTDLYDLYPTFLDGLGLGGEPGLLGRSLLAPAQAEVRLRHYHFYDPDPDRIVAGRYVRYRIDAGGALEREGEISLHW